MHAYGNYYMVVLLSLMFLVLVGMGKEAMCTVQIISDGFLGVTLWHNNKKLEPVYVVMKQ